MNSTGFSQVFNIHLFFTYFIRFVKRGKEETDCFFLIFFWMAGLAAFGSRNFSGRDLRVMR